MERQESMQKAVHPQLRYAHTTLRIEPRSMHLDGALLRCSNDRQHNKRQALLKRVHTSYEISAPRTLGKGNMLCLSTLTLLVQTPDTIPTLFYK
jgi:hypothetical protein